MITSLIRREDIVHEKDMNIKDERIQLKKSTSVEIYPVEDNSIVNLKNCKPICAGLKESFFLSTFFAFLFRLN
jgi:hypothetical protein